VQNGYHSHKPRGPNDAIILERVDPIFYEEPLAAALKALGIG